MPKMTLTLDEEEFKAWVKRAFATERGEAPTGVEFKVTPEHDYHDRPTGTYGVKLVVTFQAPPTA